MENTVEMMTTQVQDDAALTAEAPQTLADVIGSPAPEQPAVETPEAAEQAPAKEPGWIKQRVEAAAAKAIAKAEARIRAEYEAQLAPLREAQLDREADQLVAAGKIADKEMALTYLRATKNMPAPAPAAAPEAQPRDESGRFVAREATPPEAVQQRANMLVQQANNIKQATGIDVMALYDTDNDVRQKIISGEWDFTNVLMAANAASAAPAAPAPVRSANSLGMGGVSIRNMTSEQFSRLNEALERGVKVDGRV